MTYITEWLKGEGRIAEAGRVARALGQPRYYGCHFGMKSTRDRDMAVFYEAYDAYKAPTSFDVYWAQGLYEANCSIERVKEMVGFDDNDILIVIARDGYANDYVDVFPVCIVPHLAGLHSEGMAHIEANSPK